MDPEPPETSALGPEPAETRITGGGAAAAIPDRTIGPYKILKELGHGGMGVVYLAARADEQYEKHVAIKVIRAGADSTEVVRHFRRERQILASLDHPNIARLLDGGTTETGLPYLVMEYIQGQPLQDYCDSHRIALPGRLRTFQQVCSAVTYAHRNLIVHRDLKPSNILVTEDGVPHLLDFGIAKLLNPDVAVDAPTATGLALTPEYASPEQARGEIVTTSSDVYSLGVILYELLTGRRPYRLKTRQPLEILRAVLEDEPDRPSTVASRTVEATSGGEATIALTMDEVGRTGDWAPDRLARHLRGDLDAIVLMALRKEPVKRYPSVEAFSEDIGRHLDGQPVLARKGSRAYRAGKYLRRHAIGVASAAAFVLLLATLAVSMTVQSARLARERDLAAKERDKAEKVSSFMVNLFRVSDPSEAKGNSVTAREILDKGSASIGSELKEQPEVKAALLDTMSRVYISLGLYPKALPLAEDALKLRREALGSDSLDVAKSLNTLSIVLRHKGDYKGAEPLSREALKIQEKHLGHENRDVASTINTLGIILWHQGDSQGAETLIRDSLAIRRKLDGNDNAEVAATLDNLANVLDEKGDSAQAETLSREALALRRKLLGNDHPAVAQNLNNLGTLLDERGETEEAEQVYREALEMWRKILGPEHPYVAISLNNLADVLEERGDYKAAEPLYRDVLAMRRKLLGNEHPDVAGSLNNLAAILDDEGNYKEAEPVAREGLAMRRKLLGNSHPHVALSLTTLGGALEGQHRLGEAEQAYREALEVRRKALPAEHPEIADNLLKLGTILMEEKPSEDAQAMLREGLAIRQKTLPKDAPDVASAESAVGFGLVRLRKFDEAEPLLLRSYALLKEKERDGGSTREARHHLVELYTAWGKKEKASEYLDAPKGSVAAR
jgi:serine/threonine-protein kinase